MAEKKDTGTKTGLKSRSKVWIEFQGEVVFGSGRMVLLEAIKDTGSIRQAAARLGMSYRAAWGKIKATEERLGITLLETHAGGHRSGASLTPAGKELLAVYRRFKVHSDSAVDELFNDYFGTFLAKQVKASKEHETIQDRK